ncbi:hypothetical protein TNCV_990241 [Trichonephila clavipes]|nr:hypothetical protein TNCV_990241 [Trichonephila clavipes]
MSVSVAVRRPADSKAKYQSLNSCDMLHASIVISEKRNNDLDPSEFEKGMIVGMRCAGCSVTETAIYLGRKEYRTAVMTAYKKCGNVTSGKHNSDGKESLPIGIKTLPA